LVVEHTTSGWLRYRSSEEDDALRERWHQRGRAKSMDTLFGLLQLGLMAAFSIIWVAVLVSVLWSKIARNGKTAHAPRPVVSPLAADKA
jgi:hypothetical protein